MQRVANFPVDRYQALSEASGEAATEAELIPEPAVLTDARLVRQSRVTGYEHAASRRSRTGIGSTRASLRN